MAETQTKTARDNGIYASVQVRRDSKAFKMAEQYAIRNKGETINGILRRSLDRYMDLVPVVIAVAQTLERFFLAATPQEEAEAVTVAGALLEATGVVAGDLTEKQIMRRLALVLEEEAKK